jgi:DNA-binding NarL/FixJ family response regulator
MPKPQIRVLCVDDHRVVLEGVAAMIRRQAADMKVVASAVTGEEAVASFERHQPDVTLMDLQLPGISGLEAIRQIRQLRPNARIIVLTMFQGDEDIYCALQAGAATYLLKDVLTRDLVRTIREVHAGRCPIPPAVAAHLSAHPDHAALSPREVAVVELIAQGRRNKEIAGELGISVETTKVHVKKLLGKLAVRDRAAAVTVALRRGIIHLR